MLLGLVNTDIDKLSANIVITIIMLLLRLFDRIYNVVLYYRFDENSKFLEAPLHLPKRFPCWACSHRFSFDKKSVHTVQVVYEPGLQL